MDGSDAALVINTGVPAIGEMVNNMDIPEQPEPFNMKAKVGKKTYNVGDKNIIFILDETYSMTRTGGIQPLENAFQTVMNNCITDESTNFYITSLIYATQTTEVGPLTNVSERNSYRDKVLSEYNPYAKRRRNREF